jgi:hypothetical protein
MSHAPPLNHRRHSKFSRVIKAANYEGGNEEVKHFNVITKTRKSRNKNMPNWMMTKILFF